MAEPTKKSSGIEAKLQAFGEAAGMKRDRHVAIRTNQCVSCDSEAVSFKDEISRKEYTISGMCQTCQDSFFG